MSERQSLELLSKSDEQITTKKQLCSKSKDSLNMDTAVRETTVYRVTVWIANKKLQRSSIYFSVALKTGKSKMMMYFPGQGIK